MEITPEAPSVSQAFQAPSQGLSPENLIWQRELQQAFKTTGDLLDYLSIKRPAGVLQNTPFPVRVPRPFANKMEPGNPQDPLLLQVLPQAAEGLSLPGFVPDAVGDCHAQKAPGLLHKYSNRVLLLPTSQCAIHCRYCFRKEFAYADLPKLESDWDAAFEYLAVTPGIEEVILSGGDPLSLSDVKLARLCERVLQTKGLCTLRWHTRYPIVLPSRIHSGFLNWIRELTQKISLVIVVHANHPQEIGEDVVFALAGLRAAGATLLNQSVLLKGINDNAQTLASLSKKLFAAGTLPYYLSQLDRVTGTGHFEVPLPRAKALIQELRGLIQGYLVPRFVQEISGHPYKEPVG